MIAVCICTHNPRREILDTVVQSLVGQTATSNRFRVLVIDNASFPKIEEDVLAPLHAAGVPGSLILESRPGIARARATAAEQSTDDWVLFVDDDNELDDDYISNGLEIIRHNPGLGCFGGKLLLPAATIPPRWAVPFVPFLGIRDHGEQRIEKRSDHWGPWEPPTAGAFVHREVLNEYLRRSTENAVFFRLGRTGSRHLLSCEDSIMMRGATAVGRSNAYEPSLRLFHHLAPHRFRLRYLLRLMYGYGLSHATLETILRPGCGVPQYYAQLRTFVQTIRWTVLPERKKSWAFALGMFLYHLGARREYRAHQRERAGLSASC